MWNGRGWYGFVGTILTSMTDISLAYMLWRYVMFAYKCHNFVDLNVLKYLFPLMKKTSIVSFENF